MHIGQFVRERTLAYMGDNPVVVISSSTHTAPASGLNFIRFGDGTGGSWINCDIDFVRYSSKGAYSIPEQGK